MTMAGFTRKYVILRPLTGSAGGFIRLEMKQGRLCAAVRVNQLPCASLRVLLLCGTPSTGAVIDLGAMYPVQKNQASLYRDDLPQRYADCHTAVVCRDWPDPQLLLYGWLISRPPCTLWQLQETIAQYLSVPAKDGIPPEHTPPYPDTTRLPLCMVLRR